MQDECAERLGDRRRRSRTDARAQGRRRRRRGGRAHRRTARPRRFQHDAVGHLHVARDRVGRPERTAAESGRPRLPRRRISIFRERPRAGDGRHDGIRQDACGCEHRSHPRRSRHRTIRVRADRRRRRGDGVRRVERRSGAHLPRAPIALRSDARSRPWRRQAHAEPLAGVIEADYPGQIARRHGALIDYLEPELARRNSTLDHAQAAALDRLQQLADELVAFRSARQSALRRLFAPPDVPRGVYLCGGVGRGKTFLMDAFYATAGVRRKTRVHFHAFMRAVHADLAALKSEADPLAIVAERIAARWRLICFDEFHVSDIADAMILGRLLSALFTRGVVFVMTSNYRPDRLWPDGLQRERFLPAIALLEQWLDVVELDAGVDYRLRALTHMPVYHTPAGPGSDAALRRSFDAIATGPDEDLRIAVDGRTVVAKRRAGSLAWFDFAALCVGPRSQRDYLDLAQRFAVILISGIPRMAPAMADQARRFTWLVDILYDHHVKLLASADAPADELYVEGPNARDFARTVSRLIEMRTRDYMALPHTLPGHCTRPVALR